MVEAGKLQKILQNSRFLKEIISNVCVVVVNNPGLIVLALQGKTQSHGDNNYLGIALGSGSGSASRMPSTGGGLSKPGVVGLAPGLAQP